MKDFRGRLEEERGYLLRYARLQLREPQAAEEAVQETLLAADEDGDDFDALFDERGHWREFPPAWGDPDAALNEKQFFVKLEECLARLPKKTARVFMMREHMGFETGEICKELGITATHCWVLLYRARMALRECLEVNWFGKT